MVALKHKRHSPLMATTASNPSATSGDKAANYSNKETAERVGTPEGLAMVGCVIHSHAGDNKSE